MENLKFDFTNMFADAVGESNGIKESDVEAVHDKAIKAHEKLTETRKRGEIGFYDLPGDKANVDNILETSKMICSRFENLVVLGIGGSALGMRCLESALLPSNYNMLPARGRRGCPRLFVCDNIDPDAFEDLLESIDWKQTCVNVVSKSGRTTETVAQYFLAKDILVRKFGRERWRESRPRRRRAPD